MGKPPDTGLAAPYCSHLADCDTNQAEHDDAYVLKVFAFQAVNSWGPMFLTAYAEDDTSSILAPPTAELTYGVRIDSWLFWQYCSA